MIISILAIGDVCGVPGLTVLEKKLKTKSMASWNTKLTKTRVPSWVKESPYSSRKVRKRMGGMPKTLAMAG